MKKDTTGLAEDGRQKITFGEETEALISVSFVIRLVLNTARLTLSFRIHVCIIYLAAAKAPLSATSVANESKLLSKHMCW